MRATLTLLVLGLFVLSAVPGVFATAVGSGITPDIITEDFAPMVWMCDSRIVYDDNTEPGRISGGGQELVERIYNYAFEGEQIHWTVLVFDKNGIDKVNDVYVTLGSSQGAGNDIEANCQLTSILPAGSDPSDECNARILEEELEDVQALTAAYYDCTFTVETGLEDGGMYGEYWVTVEATDIDGLQGTMDENEYWFFNPVIALSIDGDMTFEDVRPGTQTYSQTMLIGNDADAGSGVMLDMFISGTDFYDSSSSGARCPTTNQLSLDNFAYYASKGAYSTQDDPRSDAEGYVPIEYGIGFNNPNPFYDNNEIMQVQRIGPYYVANTLTPGSEMAMTFRLSLPEPCNGNFDTGAIYFWGEAI